MATTERRVIQLDVDSARANSRLRSIDRNMRSTANSSLKLSQSMTRMNMAFGALGGAFAGRAFFQLADEFTAMNNRLKIFTNTAEEANVVQEALVQTANNTFSSYEQTATIFTRLARSMNGITVSGEELIGITAAINQSFVLAGSTAQEARSASLQLSQAMGAGALQGEELRAVLESNIVLSKAFAAQLGITVGELKKMGASGAITTEVMVRGIQAAADSWNEDFSKAVPTAGMAMMALSNTFGQYLSQVSQATEFNKHFANSLRFLADHLTEILIPAIALVAAVIITKLIFAVKALSVAIRANLFFAAMGLMVVAVAAAATQFVKHWELLVATTRFGLEILSSAVEVGTLELGIALTKLAQQIVTGIVSLLEKASNTIKDFSLLILLPYEKLGLIEIPDFDFSSFGEGFGDEVIATFESEIAILQPKLDKLMGDFISKLPGTEAAGSDYMQKLKDLMLSFGNDIIPGGGAAGSKSGKNKIEDIVKMIEKLKKEIAQFNMSELEKLNDEIDRMKGTNEQKDFAKAYAAERDGLKQEAEALKFLQEVVAGNDAFSSERAELEKINEVMKQFPDLAAEYAEALTSRQAELTGKIDGTTEALEKQAEAMQQFGDFMADAFTDGIMEGKKFEDVLKDILTQLLKMALNAAFKTMFGGSGGGDFMSVFMSSFGGARANGGPVQAGRSYIVGERQPELFIPSQNGTIVPQVGGGGSTQINVYNNNGSDVQVEEESDGHGGTNIQVIIDTAVKDAMSSGRLDKTMQQSFGVSRAGSM